VPLLLHGVVESRAVDPLTARLSAEGVQLPTHRQLAALVSSNPASEALPSRANLLAHTRILESATLEVTVVPMRFGIVVEHVEALVETLLEPQHDALLDSLRQLEGHVELRLRGSYDEEAVIRDVLDADRRAARLRGRGGMEAKMELGERIVAGIEARRGQDVERVTQALRSHVSGVVANSASQPLDAFDLSLLVARDRMPEFDAQVDELGRALAPTVALELVGPLPPFSFTLAEAG
jgi:hypothetical protein